MMSGQYKCAPEELQVAEEEFPNAIKRIMQQEPELTSIGFICHSKDYRADDWGYFMSQLLDDPDNALQFYLVSLWLEGCIKTKSANRGLSSYLLKGLVERQYGHYIGNGILIAAAMHCGFHVHRDPLEFSPNGRIGIARSSLALKSPPYPSK